jgi:hypothetical protein
MQKEICEIRPLRPAKTSRSCQPPLPANAAYAEKSHSFNSKRLLC